MAAFGNNFEHPSIYCTLTPRRGFEMAILMKSIIISMKKITAVFLIISILVGCASNGSLNNQAIGTAVGGVLGGMIGAYAGHGTGRYLSTAIGTAIGGVIGNQLGAWLDEKDREAINQASAKALVSAPAGQDVVWSNPETGNSAVITSKAPVVEERTVALVRNKSVSPLPKLDLIGETWDAKKVASVRAAPRTDAKVVSSLKAGEQFTAVGKVAGEDWIVVARGKRTIGYVSSKVVGKLETTASIASADSTTVRKAINLDTIEKDRAIDLDAADTVAQQLVVNQSCRVMNIKVSSQSGQTDQGSTKACKAPDGAWEIL